MRPSAGRFPTVAAIAPRTVVTAGENRPVRHAFAPALHVHPGGDYLLVCRWDVIGSREGDASNQQALSISRDAGQTWHLAHDGRPIVSPAHGTSFSAPSAITHAWFLPHTSGRLSLIYSVNQPHTWGADDPQRSTGGGEIRRVELQRSPSGEWRSAPASAVIWRFQAPLPDGLGGICHDIRAVSWNGAVRTNEGVWLMPIGGRSSQTDPRGDAAPLNRVWLLRSDDDGYTWGSPVFVAGGDEHAFAEPTLVATSDPARWVCLLRVQYETGRELYRADSLDGGKTWSKPVPTGLPNADTHGAKPFLFRAKAGDYWLVQTNEHTTIARTNLALFHTDETGLLSDRWQRVRTLDIGHRAGWWPGSCYGWIAEDIGRNRILIAYATATPHETELRFSAVDRAAYFSGPTAEPNGVHDEIADDRPLLLPDSADPPPAPAYRLVSTRSRLIATRFVDLGPRPLQVSFSLSISTLPESANFPLFTLANRHGRDPAFALQLSPVGQLLAWVSGNSTRIVRLRHGFDHQITCLLRSTEFSTIKIDDHSFPLPQLAEMRSASLQWGGGPIFREVCHLRLGRIHYQHPV